MDYSQPAATPQAPAAGSGTDAQRDQRDIRALRLSVSLMLVALVILSGSLGVYFFRQVSLLRRQTEATARNASQAVQHYKQNIEPQAVLFERQLREFANTNADFQARIAKYFPAEVQGASSNAVPAPAAQTPAASPAAAPATPAR